MWEKIEKISSKKISPTFLLVIFGLIVYLPLWVGSISVSSSQIGRIDYPLPVLGSDSVEYTTLANNISKLGCFTMTDCLSHETFRTPGYPFLVSIISNIFGSLFAVTFIQCLISLLTGFIVYKIALLYVNKRLSSYAMLFFILEPSTILHSLVILSDITYIFLITLSFFIIIKSKPTSTSFFFSGLILGISVLFRPISLFIVPIFIAIYAYLYFVNKKDLLLKVVLITISFFVVLIPWYHRNNKLSGILGISSVGIYNITYYNIPLFLSYKEGITVEQAQKEVISLSGITQKEGLKLENSKILSKVSTKYLKENIFSYLFFHIIKTTPFFFGSSIKNIIYSYNTLYNNDINYEYYTGSFSGLFLSGHIKSLMEILLSEGIFFVERLFWLAILIIGVFPIFKKETRKIVLVCWLMILYFALLTGPVSYVRYRLPAEPFMFILLVIGIAQIYPYVKHFYNRIYAY